MRQNDNIRKQFIDGVQLVFSTMFNDGKKDGVYYYPQIEQEKNIYDEQESKVYGSPVLLVAKVVLNMSQDVEEVSVIKGKATFTIPYKDLMLKGVEFDVKDYQTLRMGLIRFGDTFFEIDNINPHAFVEQVFLLYDFVCTEIKDMSDISFEEGFDDVANIGVNDYADED